MSAKHRPGDENSSCADSASEPVRRTERIRRLAKHTLAESSDDSSDSEGVPGQLTSTNMCDFNQHLESNYVQRTLDISPTQVTTREAM
jgi:hypothetical protein